MSLCNACKQNESDPSSAYCHCRNDYTCLDLKALIDASVEKAVREEREDVLASLRADAVMFRRNGELSPYIHELLERFSTLRHVRK